MDTAVALGGRSPTCYRKKKEFLSKQQSFDIEAILRTLVRPRYNPSPWKFEERTNQQVYDFVVGFFEDSLASLKTVGSAAEKADVLEWIFEPPVVHLIDNDLMFPVRTEKLAFSFRWCCRLFGYDAEDLQQQLLDDLISLDCYKQHRAIFDHYRDTYRI